MDIIVSFKEDKSKSETSLEIRKIVSSILKLSETNYYTPGKGLIVNSNSTLTY
jgi:hypothetical protein